MSAATADELVVTRVDAGVLRVTLNRAATKNALNLAMYRTLAATLENASADDAIRAVLLDGGDCFCAGNDLNDFVATPPPDEHSPVLRFLLALRALEPPLIAAVDGPAIGIGTTLLLHCDLVYAAPRAFFQLPFTALGLCPEAGSSLLLPNCIGLRRAAEMLLLGEPLSAAAAAEVGLINAVIDAERLLDHAAERAARLAALPPGAVAVSKSLIKHAGADRLGDPLVEVMRHEAAHFAALLTTPDAQRILGALTASPPRPPDTAAS